VILLTDAASAVPALIQPSGQTALVSGDNTAAPLIDFLENPDLVRAGDRVISSGDGGVFPAGLLIGQIATDPAGRLRVRLAADYERLEFLRVLRHLGVEPVTDPGNIVAPVNTPVSAPVSSAGDDPVQPVEEGAGDG
jgi:rod shape-determining protein MreC